MFDIDKWQEIFATLRQNKLRTFLTGFSVAWGIFMLIILLGAGNGIQNAIEYSFRSSKINSLWIWNGQTSLNYKGLKPGRNIQMNNDDYAHVKNMEKKNISRLSSRFQIPGDNIVSYGKKVPDLKFVPYIPNVRQLKKLNLRKDDFLTILILPKHER